MPNIQTATAEVRFVAAAFVVLSEKLAGDWGREVDHDATYDYLEILNPSDFPAESTAALAAQVWFAADTDTRIAAMGWL